MIRRLPALPSVVRASCAAALLAILVAMPAWAVDGPLRLRTEVTDQAGVLSGTDETEVAAALGALREDTGVQLFVAYIDTTAPSGTPDINTWTTDTAAVSSLGGNDALLVVAIDDRAYAMWVADSLEEITDDEVDAILAEALEPELVDGDFAGAMVAAAEATRVAFETGGPAGTEAPTAAPEATAIPGSSGTGSGGGLSIMPILAVLLLAGGGYLLFRSFRARRVQGAAQQATVDQLGVEANRALLAADEALKDAANDVDFAAAQWGDDEVIAYRDAIRQASGELRASFAIRQRLDDADPEPLPEREQLLREIVARCTRAQQLLDAQEQRFDDLQALQASAPEQLRALPAAIEGLRARRAQADATLARIRAAYAPAAVASVEGNLAEAGKAIDAAAAEAARGSGVVATRPAEGVVALRHAQEALARATQLVDAVDRLGASLDDAAARLPGELRAAAADVESARQAVERLGSVPAPPPVPGAPALPAGDPVTALREAEAALDDARRAAEARPPDPLTALQHAVAANDAADALLARAADAEAQVARRRQAAQAAIAAARGHVSRAVDYITSRRHGVGETARTRAAEAEMRLEEALALVDGNPEAAAASANRAIALADEAYRLASGEFDGWNRAGGPVAGPYAGRDAGADIAGAVLGGIIGAVLSGSGRSGPTGSGWGGSPWGGGGGRSSGGFGLPRGPLGGGGRSRGGGFGLPRGGGLGGGGGRVRGGRW